MTLVLEGRVRQFQAPRAFDEDLLRYETIWAAAGTPRSVFAIDPQRLLEITGGQVADFVERRPKE